MNTNEGTTLAVPNSQRGSREGTSLWIPVEVRNELDELVDALRQERGNAGLKRPDVMREALALYRRLNSHILTAYQTSTGSREGER